MSKPLLIPLLITQFLFAVFTQAQASNNAYALEQITRHLNTVYSEDLKREDGLRRWDMATLTYDVATSEKALTETEKQVFFKQFEKYGKIVGIDVERNRQAGKTDIVLIFTNDFHRTVRNPNLRRPLFGGLTQKSVNKIIADFKKEGRTSYGVQYSIKSHKIDREYSLSQTSKDMRKYLEQWSDYVVFNSFAVRWWSRRSNVIKPSIFNRQKNKQNIKLHPIDRYYLEVLYSDKVHYGMEMKQAIKIMANEIYKKLEENSNE